MLYGYARGAAWMIFATAGIGGLVIAAVDVLTQQTVDWRRWFCIVFVGFGMLLTAIYLRICEQEGRTIPSLAKNIIAGFIVLSVGIGYLVF